MNLIEIIQNLQICYLKFHTMNDDFQAILKTHVHINIYIYIYIYKILLHYYHMNMYHFIPLILVGMARPA